MGIVTEVDDDGVGDEGWSPFIDDAFDSISPGNIMQVFVVYLNYVSGFHVRDEPWGQKG